MRLTSLARAVLLLGLCAEPRALAGADAGESAQAFPPRVDVAIVGSMPGGDALGSRVESWFAAQPTTVSVRSMPLLAAGEVLGARELTGVKVWVVLRSPSVARLFFAVAETEAGTPRYLVRDVTLDGGLDELGMEQVTQVIYVSALALWSGTLQSSRQDVERGLAPDPAPHRPATARPEAAPARSRAGFSSAIGVGYSARFAGEEGTTHAPSATFGVQHPVGRLTIGGRFEAALLLPHRAQENGLTLDLHGVSFAAGALLLGELFDGTSGSVELGAGFDVVNFEALSIDDPTLRAEADETESRPFVRVRSGVVRALGPVSLGVGAGLSIQLFRTHYDAEDGAKRSELLAPWLLQPELDASVTW
jgi:hypothetical protein